MYLIFKAFLFLPLGIFFCSVSIDSIAIFFLISVPQKNAYELTVCFMRYLRIPLITLLLLSPSFSFAEEETTPGEEQSSHLRFDSFMSCEEREMTGVSKLSEGELLQLEEWIVQNWIEDLGSEEAPANEEEHQVIFANYKEGRFFMLKDGSYWETVFTERKKASRWLRNDKVCITGSGRLDLPYLLHNQRTSDSIIARQVDPKLPTTMSMFR